MAEPIRTLSTDDVRILRMLIDAYKNGRLNIQSKSKPDDEPQAMDVFIARPQTSEGIPGREDDPPVAGEADCDLYRLNQNDDGDQELERMGEAFKRVYNFTLDDVPDDFFPIIKTKGGKWIPLLGGGAKVILFEVKTLQEDVKTSLTYGTCRVLGHACGGGVPLMDPDSRELEVWDEAGCHFDEDNEDMIGRKGFAIYMTVWDDITGTATSTGTGTGETDCKWVVFSLCCPEET